jgi:hypothetical protein
MLAIFIVFSSGGFMFRSQLFSVAPPRATGASGGMGVIVEYALARRKPMTQTATGP